MTYGMPYKGSKNAIAKWVIDNLPPADTFVDLFAGGCAATHAAMLSGKYRRFVCNDISGTPFLFKEAMHGDFKGYSSIPDREAFFMSDDIAVKMLFSYGSDMQSYAYGKHVDAIKTSAEKMLSAPSMHERRYHYRQFMKELHKYIDGVLADPDAAMKKPYCLQGLERLERLEHLEHLEHLDIYKCFEPTVSDYRNVNLPVDAVIYADPPYRDTSEQYGGFDHDAFDKWLAEVDRPVFVSEYTAPAGCVCIAETQRTGHLAATNNNNVKIERLFIQEKFHPNKC